MVYIYASDKKKMPHLPVIGLRSQDSRPLTFTFATFESILPCHFVLLLF